MISSSFRSCLLVFGSQRHACHCSSVLLHTFSYTLVAFAEYAFQSGSLSVLCTHDEMAMLSTANAGVLLKYLKSNICFIKFSSIGCASRSLYSTRFFGLLIVTAASYTCEHDLCYLSCGQTYKVRLLFVQRCIPSTLLPVSTTMRRLSLKFRKSRAPKSDLNIGSRAPVDESLLSDAGLIKGDDFSTCALRVAEVTAGVVGGVPVVGGYVGGGMQAIVQQAQVSTSCCLSISADSFLRIARTVWILLSLCASVAIRCWNTFVGGTRRRSCRI